MGRGAKLENPDFVDQNNLLAVRNCLEGHADVLERQGSVQESWRVYRGRCLGPYFRVAFRRDGRQHSVYLGRDAALANAIRAFLEELQEPRRGQQDLERLRRLARAFCKGHQRKLRDYLQGIGLTLKGSEVRGWRSQRDPQEGHPENGS